MTNVTYIEGNGKIENYLRGAQHYNNCPFCDVVNRPELLLIAPINSNSEFNRLNHAVYRCANEKCQRVFIVEYEGHQIGFGKFEYEFAKIFPKHNSKDLNDDVLYAISPIFIQIYNQAKQAEDMGLEQICGMGYRKALEFLIKDFVIFNNTDADTIEKVKKQNISRCIDDYIDNAKIKAISKKAVWLGNDETHYVRKWLDRDIVDLKKLIEITCYHIKMDYSYKMYEEEMQR